MLQRYDAYILAIFSSRMAISVWMLAVDHVTAILLLPLVLCVIRTVPMANVPACPMWTHPRALSLSLGITSGILTMSSLRLKRQNYQRYTKYV